MLINLYLKNLRSYLNYYNYWYDTNRKSFIELVYFNEYSISNAAMTLAMREQEKDLKDKNKNEHPLIHVKYLRNCKSA